MHERLVTRKQLLPLAAVAVLAFGLLPAQAADRVVLAEYFTSPT